MIGLEWMQDGLCAQTDPELFYPTVGGASVRAAKAVCAACPVLAECREYALERGEVYGVWGGLSEPERRALRRKAAAASDVAVERQVALRHKTVPATTDPPVAA